MEIVIQLALKRLRRKKRRAMNRSRFGYWEGDLFLFSKQRENIITTQERKSRLFKAKLNPCKEKDISMKKPEKIMSTIPG